MRFEDLDLLPPLLAAVAGEGYDKPTPIQERAIPPALEGRDVLGCAQTGTGKTAAFALPILQYLCNNPPRKDKSGKSPVRALILTPTRELAAQVAESFETYGAKTELRTTTVYGGVSQGPQAQALRRGVDICVATPGRLIDLEGQRIISLKGVEVFVLDEADRMLDMGFFPDIRRIVNMLPNKRQTLFFSATLPPEIRHLTESILTDPIYVAVDPPASTVELTRQEVRFVERWDKIELLTHLLADPEYSRVLVFARTKSWCEMVAKLLQRAGVNAQAIHGNKTQEARTKALEEFKSGKTRVLVATDIAARGIDVEDISHVVNFDLPDEPEVYVHRIGRTGRAGHEGIALSFCAMQERNELKSIERLVGMHLHRLEDHPYQSKYLPPLPTVLPDSHLDKGGTDDPGASLKRRRNLGRRYPGGGRLAGFRKRR